ncbi:UPF0728 protein C10orf53 homolog [Corvus hawaiiensis]|uniref:UPF0728 protein C10orf53 homolog n=1 Tax=Corvus hawaiiensis TaxID=134902 RepID=UPI002018F8D6|nr:UPF0728 protein C10orf53 homolog [Corvus hawaiiensis]
MFEKRRPLQIIQLQWNWDRETILKADGHHVIQKVVTDWNAVDLVVDREIVFHCNIHDLDFGNGKLDPRCEEARKAVLNA